MDQQKRRISILIPFQNTGSEIKIFFQRRSHDMQTLPDHFGFWGGGAEGIETSEEALLREVKEELGVNLDLKKVKFVNHYEFLRNAKDVYLLDVPDHWEDSIVVGEGDYGQWFLTNEALERPDIIFEDKVVINDIERLLLKKPIR